MSGNNVPQYSYQRLTASGKVKNAPGTLGGFIVASASTGTIQLLDSTTNSGTIILNTMALTPGQDYELPVEFSKGCYAVIGGTADITFWVY